MVFLHRRGSVKDTGGAGIFLTAPGQEDFQYCVKFGFPVTNNVAEYEALTIGLDLVRRVGVKNLKAFVDSQLVAR